MTYTDETKRILEAVISGDCCPDCSAPNGDRHFDECPQHPDVAAKVLRQIVYGHRKRTGRCSCGVRLTAPGDASYARHISTHQLAALKAAGYTVALERRPLVPIVDDLASERLDGLRADNDQLRRDIVKAEEAAHAALVEAEKMADENDALRRQLADFEVER